MSEDFITGQNRRAWNQESRDGGYWSRPVHADSIARARCGEWSVILTPRKAVPRDWFPADLRDCRVLCLASGGGQQAPILAAAGARVTSLDLSEEQLARDREVADREGLELKTLRGSMTDLSAFPDAHFDLVFHSISNLFVPKIRPVWGECFRVLKPGAALLAGFMNPAFFLFNHDEALESGELKVCYPQPYSDLTSLTDDEEAAVREDRQTMEFGHSLEDQIGGQLAAGFFLAGLFEDHWDDAATPLNVYMPTSIATRAVKPG